MAEPSLTNPLDILDEVECLYQGCKLIAPRAFWLAGPNERAQVSNGIGPQFLPFSLNTIWGLNCKIVGDIHDWQYAYALPELAQKLHADRVFANNGYRWVRCHSGNRFTRWLRVRRIVHYSFLLRECGGMSFWSDKNQELPEGLAGGEPLDVGAMSRVLMKSPAVPLASRMQIAELHERLVRHG